MLSIKNLIRNSFLWIFFRPIRVKFEGEILARWKKKSKNTNHTLILGFGRSLILRHYSEDIINKLRELKLIL